MTTHEVTEKLLKIKKIIQVFHINSLSCVHVYSGNRDRDIVLPTEELHLLLNPFSFDPAHNTTYVKLYLPDGKTKYLHQLISPAPTGYLTHHVYQDGLINSREGLQVCSWGLHSREHLRLRREYQLGVLS